MAYERPQVTVDQNMTIAPTSIERPQPAFIFGPNYELHRYSDESEKAGTYIGMFDGTKASPMYSEYPKVIDPEMVDVRFTKLTGDNVVVQIADLTPDTEHATLPEVNVSPERRAVKGGYSMLLFSRVYFDADPESSSYVLENPPLRKDIKIGDKILVTYKDVGSDTPNHFTSLVEKVEYKYGDFQIGSSDSSPEGGEGTLITLEDAIPETADTNSVKASLVETFSGVEFTRKNIKKQSGYQWEQTRENGIETFTVDGKKIFGIKINELWALIKDYYPEEEYGEGEYGVYCKVLFADLYLTYRELSTAYSDTFHSVVGASEVYNLLGTVDPDNPLAMGVYMAALNSATDDGDEAPPVYFMAVPSDDAAGYDAVLNAASLTDKAYVFSATTRDDAIIEKLQSHVLEMSVKTVKQWRIAAASADIPRDKQVLGPAMDAQGDEFLAIPLADTESGTDYKYLRVVKSLIDKNGSQDTSFRSTVKPGDTVRFGYHTNSWTETDYDTYVVKKVINNYTIEVVTTDGYINTENLDHNEDGFKPSTIEIYHTYTAAEQADQIASISSHMASRRMLNVFPSVFVNNGVMMTGEFAACAVAGLISATEPQQPITNVVVRGIDEIPLAYQTFNKTQLDTIASGGTFIVTQDLPGDRVYVRHQITTAYPDGNLNTAELSITKNVDSISYAFAEVYRPYYGRYNITPELISIFRNLAGQLISQLGSVDSVYGPQLIVENTEVRYIRQNELMKDHVDIGITLGVPYPCNNIDIVLTV